MIINESRKRHGGNTRRLSEEARLPRKQILDFSASINPLGFPAGLRGWLSRAVEDLVHYPDPSATALREAVADCFSVSPDCVVPGNGTSELIYTLAGLPGLKRALIPAPAYGDYTDAALVAGLEPEHIACDPAQDFHVDLEALRSALRRGPGLVFLGQPSNPAGVLTPGEDILRLAADFPESLFCVDEAFADFVTDYESLAPACGENLLVLRSMTKFYAVPGLRLGYALAGPELALKLGSRMPCWTVNTLAQAVAPELIKDTEFRNQTLELVAAERGYLFEALTAFPGLKPFPGRANFLLVRLEETGSGGQTAPLLRAALLKKGIALRDCSDFPALSEKYFRIAVRGRQENRRLLEALEEVLQKKPRPARPVRRATPLMLQGTCSNAGKSVLTAAFCRIFLQDGFNVAPFKAQNMSLNSFVTADGGEMGRAQVVQAQACRKEPDVRMNPVLLKPSSDTGCQVILNGKVLESMRAREYYRTKAALFPAVKECYASLAAEHDIIVLEGAGSPAEVNLRAHDIVNMEMAAFAGAPVLLTGDIDRGGVIASFIGTLEVLSEADRELIKGFLINKFRGEVRLLDPAFAYIQAFSGRDVLGTIPWIRDLGLPEEDSVSFKQELMGSASRGTEEGEAGVVRIALVDLPHISNFTDIDALRLEPDTEVRIIRRAGDLEKPCDVVIIPGSKNVIGDMQYLRSTGLGAAILGLANTGKVEIVGICGGFQILGRDIADPGGIESSAEPACGLGLLPLETRLHPEKILKRSEALHTPSGLPLHGYEIHHGVTRAGGIAPCVVDGKGNALGYAHGERPCWGTYLHGLFDADEFRRWFLDRVRERKGMKPLVDIQVVYDLEAALDKLAGIVRENVSMDRIYGIMGL